MRRAELVESAASGRDAAGAAFELELDYLHRVLRRHGVRTEDVEDLIQEVFVVMCRRWGDFQRDRPLRPWLAGIAVHLAYKSSARRGREIPASHIDITERASPVDDRVAARALLHAALAAVPETNRQAMVLHEVEGLSVREVAEALGIPVATAYTRVGRARRAFTEAARKLQTETVAGRKLAPIALLDLARASGEAPGADLHRRVMARVRATPPSALRPRARPWLRLAWPALAGALGVSVALVLALGGPPSRRASPRQATAVLASNAGVPRAAPLPPLRARHAPATFTSTLGAGDPALGIGHGLSGYWRFDEGAGSRRAHDLSGAGRDCAVHGAAEEGLGSEGALGGSLRVGNTGWVSCPQPSGPAGELTVALWVRPERFMRYHQTVVVQHRETDGADRFVLAVKDQALVLRSAVWGQRLEAPQPLRGKQWAHVAFTHAADGGTRLYVDGQEVKDAAGAIETGPTGGSLTLGLNFEPGARKGKQKFRGQLDELAVYDRVLAAGEIAALAAGTQPGDHRALTGSPPR